MKQTSLKSVPTFKRWSRKGYGAFASLGREVRIGVLASSMCIVAADSMAAETDTTKIDHIEAVSVLADRGGVAAGALDMPRIAIDPASLTFAPKSSIEAALKPLPFVDIRQRGAKGIQADISLRGASADQTTIMLNGVNFSDARTGHQSHSLPLPFAAISQINFSPTQIAVGSFSGALDYKTPTNVADFLEADIGGGSYGSYNLATTGSYTPMQGMTIYGAASYDHSDGYIENTDFNKINIYARAKYASSAAGTIDFQIGYQNADFGSNGFYSLAYPMQWEATQTVISSLSYAKSWGKWALEAVASYRLNTDRYELYRPHYTTPPESYKGANYHITDNVGAAAKVTRNWGAVGRTSLGVDFTYNNILSTILGDKLNEPRKIGNVNYTNSKQRAQVSYFARHGVEIGRFDITAAVSVAQTPYGVNPLGGISAGYSSASGLRAELSAAHTMRLPTFTDLYYTTPTHVGNKDLVPETATNISALIGWSRNNYGLSATVYYRWGNNIIDWVQSAGDSRWHSMQITALGTFGVEFTAFYRPNRGFIQSLEASYGFINTDKSSGHYISKYALDYMRHKASIATQFRLHRKVILSLDGAYYDRSGKYFDSAGSQSDFTPYFLLDARVTWSVWKVRLWVECNNILDRKYFDFGELAQPGRWFTAGVKVKLK